MTKTAKRWLEVCSIDDIPVRGAIRVEHGTHTIAIFRTVDNQLRALEDRCPHKGGPLSDGIVHGDCVTCPLPNWDISLETGQAVGADEGQVQVHEIQLKDDRVFIEAPVVVGLTVV